MRWIVAVIVLLTSCADCSDPVGAPEGWVLGEGTPDSGTSNTNSTNNRPPPRNNPPGNNQPPPPPDNNRNPPPPVNSEPGPTDLEPVPSPCDQPDRPARCDQSPESFPWARAVVIDELVIAGTEDSPECCFDFTGDGVIDNSYGVNLAGFGFIEEINAELARAVAAGDPATILELDGLMDPTAGDFRLNWWFGAFLGPPEFFADRNEVLVSLDNVDAGSQPFTTFARARIDGSRLIASDGIVQLPITYFLLPIGPTPIRRAHLEATLNGPFPTMEGVIGGVIYVTDIFATVNRFVERECDCLGLSRPMLDKQTGMCDAATNVTTCSRQCEEVAGACNLFGAFGLFADTDLDGDGLNDAITIGARFHALPAEIMGTTEP